MRFAVVTFALISIWSCYDPTTGSEGDWKSNAGGEGRIYVTRGSMEPDKLASVWLIERHVDSGAEVRVLAIEDPEPPEAEITWFDCARARWARTRLRSTFGIILDDLGIQDPALLEIARLIDEAELQYWRMDADSPAGVLDQRLKACILEKRWDAAHAYLDLVFAGGGSPHPRKGAEVQ